MRYRFVAALAAAVLFATLPGTTVASSSPDVSLQQLSSLSQFVLLGKVVTLTPSGKLSDLGLEMNYADIEVSVVAKGNPPRKVVVLFTPMQSDEPDLELGKEYVLFLIGSSRMAEVKLFGETFPVYEVNQFDRGALWVSYGRVFSGPLLGEPAQQEARNMLKRVERGNSQSERGE